MTVRERSAHMWNLIVTNIGGIRSGTTQVEEGLNVVQASNFRGKSSLVGALRTALGATGQYDEHPLTEGVEEGVVSLATESEKYTVTLDRMSSDHVRRTGNPYLSTETDQVCARLFACLDEDNPIRKAVRNGDDLTQPLQAPLNIDDIDMQIAQHKNEERDIEEQITEAERAGEQLPSVQETVSGLETELEELRTQCQELSDEETNKERIEKLSDEISQKSGKLTTIANDISRIEREIERKERQISGKEQEVDDLDIPEKIDQSRDVDAMREDIETLNRQIALIEDLYRANQSILDAGEVDILTDIDRSIAGDEVECWVCGNRATTADIEEYISNLQSKTAALREKKDTLESKLEEVEARKREIKQSERQKKRLDREITQLKAEVDEKRGILEDKREREAALEEEITALKDELEEAEEKYNEALTDLKTAIHTTETTLQNKREKLESLESKYAELEDLEAERDDIQARLADLRNRKKKTQETLKERFNTIIDDIIEEFQPGFSSARLVLKTDNQGEVESIDLEIARDIDSKGQRTSVDALSEGEVELIGLVVALAGFHAFDVESKTPCILIDGISQLAAEHLRTVATYLDEMSDVLVTTAYPEAGTFDGHTIEPGEWDVVSDDPLASP
jgi:predicted  nucleic acid-binding Zn-ribbon protein